MVWRGIWAYAHGTYTPLPFGLIHHFHSISVNSQGHNVCVVLFWWTFYAFSPDMQATGKKIVHISAGHSNVLDVSLQHNMLWPIWIDATMEENKTRFLWCFRWIQKTENAFIIANDFFKQTKIKWTMNVWTEPGTFWLTLLPHCLHVEGKRAKCSHPTCIYIVVYFFCFALTINMALLKTIRIHIITSNVWCTQTNWKRPRLIL